MYQYFLIPVNDCLKPTSQGTLDVNADALKQYCESLSYQANIRKELYDRYTNLGGKDILTRKIYISASEKVESDVNNKIACPFEAKITDTKAGYFMGENVSITIDDYDSKIQIDGTLDDKIRELKTRVNWDSKNYEAAKLASVCGFAAKLVYINEDKKAAEVVYPAWNTFWLGQDIDDPDAGVLYYYTDEYTEGTHTKRLNIELYTRKEIYKYRESEKGNMLQLDGYPKVHFFGRCPLICFKNNSELSGDFERVVSVIDAFETVISDSVNDNEKVARAMLAIVNAGGLGENSSESDAESDERIKRTLRMFQQSGVLILGEGGSAQFLNRQIDSQYLTSLLSELRRLIFDLSGIPDFSDVSFLSAQSGYAIRLKMTGFENKVVQTEMSFQIGFKNEFECIANVEGFSSELDRIKFVFKRNLPADIESEVRNAMNAYGSGLVSKATALGLLSFVDDVNKEIENEETDFIGGEDGQGNESLLQADEEGGEVTA